GAAVGAARMRGGGVPAVSRARVGESRAGGIRHPARRAEPPPGAAGRVHRRGLGREALPARLQVRDRRPPRAAPRPGPGRRTGGDDAMVARKLRAAQRDRLTPIVCVGETLEQREAGKTADVLIRQVHAAYEGLGAASRDTVIAYEPVWAIGTGKVATPEQAGEAHEIIRATLDRVAGPGTGAKLTILYGGSVNAGNATALFAIESVDGALVGGASLEAASFFRIVSAAEGAKV